MNLSLEKIETPEVLVDRDRLIANIERAQAIARRHSLALRPHIKTHKCAAIARLQLEHGAVGITAAKPDEALEFIRRGIANSITLAFPVIDPRKFARVFEAAAGRDVEVNVTVDSAAGIEAAASAAMRETAVFVKIDVGLHRCGVEANSATLLELVRKIAESPQLKFAGLLSHAGHAYGANNPDEIAQIAEDERLALIDARMRIEADGHKVRAMSVGSTPTVLAANNFDEITEIRPGNYAFLDATAMRLQIATARDVALSVLATVVSRNERHFIIDAGSKVLSSDLGPHGTANARGYGTAFRLADFEEGRNGVTIARLSEEHGFIERNADIDFAIGERVRIIPNHACPVANLAERLAVVHAGDVVDLWPVDARAKVR